MREILFRGKRCDNGEWVYGNFVCGCEPQYAYIVEFGNKELCRNYVSICPSSVGQYTGLTDKNGVKIFEGDIINDTETGYIYKIKYGLTRFLRADKDKFYYWTFDEKDYEVIGNIHDNKEDA